MIVPLYYTGLASCLAEYVAGFLVLPTLARHELQCTSARIVQVSCAIPYPASFSFDIVICSLRGCKGQTKRYILGRTACPLCMCKAMRRHVLSCEGHPDVVWPGRAWGTRCRAMEATCSSRSHQMAFPLPTWGRRSTQWRTLRSSWIIRRTSVSLL